jgi:hypothetical protein
MNVFENEPRPTAVGGGWRLRFAIWKQVARLSLVAASPVEPGEDERDAYADAMQTGREWMMRIVDVDWDSELGYLTLEVWLVSN